MSFIHPGAGKIVLLLDDKLVVMSLAEVVLTLSNAPPVSGIKSVDDQTHANFPC